MPNMNSQVLVDTDTLDTASEIMLNAVEKIKLLTGHSQELNHVYWRLALAIGWVKDGDDKIECDPEVLMDKVETQLWRIKELDES